MPAYNDTPNATDRINDTQAPIKTNFSSLSTVISVDHVAITDANAGKHKFTTMPEQGASPTTAVNEGALFTRQGATTAVTELCFRKENNGTVTELTAGSAALPGWTYLPSGVLMKWGINTSGSTSNVDLNSVGGPNFTNVYVAFATQLSNVTYGIVGAYITGTTLQLRSVTGGQVYWIAIGK